ncbi:MAG: TolC family protein [Kofleriaceae bacterium]
MFKLVTSICLLGARFATAESITLDDALRRASARPSVAIATADRDAARGNALAADLPLYNPTLELAAGPRWSSGSVLGGASVGIGQTIELGGKRAARRDAADARVRSAASGLLGAQLAARIETWRAYELAVVARLRVESANEAEKTASEVVAATQQAQALGGETQLRLNLAIADLGKAKHDRLDAENEYAGAIADLASAIGATDIPEPSDRSPRLPAALAESLAVNAAISNRPDLVQARAEVDATNADVHVADAGAVPDITLSLTYGYEPDPDVKTHTLAVGATIALPIRTRNQGQRAVTRALAHRADVEATWLRVEVERTARVAAQRYARALAAVEAFDREVSDKLHENLQLAADSYRAGKIDFYAFSIARRDLFANRLGYLDAAAEAIEAWAAVSRASALEVTP